MDQTPLFKKKEIFEAEGEVIKITNESVKDYQIMKYEIMTPEGPFEYGYFGKTTITVGNYVHFNYVKKGPFLTIKEFTDIKVTTNIPQEQDNNEFEEQKREIRINDYVQLYNNAVSICIKRNILSDEEIKAQLTRLIKLGGLEGWAREVEKRLKKI
jgi:hypothetical protein